MTRRKTECSEEGVGMGGVGRVALKHPTRSRDVILILLIFRKGYFAPENCEKDVREGKESEAACEK